MEIKGFVGDYNQRPIDDFDGLSPMQMKDLLYNLFKENCILKKNTYLTDNTLDGIGFFCVCEKLLKIIQRKTNLKLTQTGYLPKKVVKELYDKKFIYDLATDKGVNKNFIEQNFAFILTGNYLCKVSGFIKKQQNSLSLTARGKKMLEPDKRNELFALILDNFIFRFQWSSIDCFDEEFTGQAGIGYTLYLIYKYGIKELPIKFYSDKYIKAFPRLIENYPESLYLSRTHLLYNIYLLRAFERFLKWFNFVEIKDDSHNPLNEDATVKATEIFSEVFKIVI